VGVAATLDPRALGLAATSNPRALDMNLTAKPCHGKVMTK